MRNSISFKILFFTSLFLFVQGSFAIDTVRMSSTIGPIDAGIVPFLAQKYEEKTGIPIRFEGAGTGATLDKARNGGFDLVMVHARVLEDQFIAEGYGLDRRDLMYNDFVILGPQNDPAGIKGMPDAAEAMAKIAAAKAMFVTRGDRSGTHVKEMEVWEQANIKPEGTWYNLFAEGASGNRPTTLFANQNQAYTLMDRATWLTVKNEITIIPLVEGDTILLNFIAVIAVNPEKVPDANLASARAFMNWLTGTEAQELIRTFGIDVYGQPLFFPNAGN
jgi:tungstate transport system substrate-binding protein